MEKKIVFEADKIKEILIATHNCVSALSDIMKMEEDEDPKVKVENA